MISCIIAHSVYGASQRGITPHNIIGFCKPAFHLQSHTPASIRIPRDEREMSEEILQAQINAYTQRGIIATYHGYTTFSDHNGEIRFPRKHTSDDMFYVVTRSIQPVMGQGETVQHFTITKPDEARMYYLERKQDEQQASTYWDVRELDVTQDRKVPASAMVIFSHPEHIIVPVGTFATIDDGNLILPDMYVTKDMPIGPNALAFLRVNKYFAPVTRAHTYTADRYATGLRP